MAEKRYRITFKSKDGYQYLHLLAKDKEEAQRLAERAQHRRHERFPLTFDRIQQAHERGELTADQYKAELEKRKADEARYDAGDWKITKIEEAVG